MATGSTGERKPSKTAAVCNKTVKYGGSRSVNNHGGRMHVEMSVIELAGG